MEEETQVGALLLQATALKQLGELGVSVAGAAASDATPFVDPATSAVVCAANGVVHPSHGASDLGSAGSSQLWQAALAGMAEPAIEMLKRLSQQQDLNLGHAGADDAQPTTVGLQPSRQPNHQNSLGGARGKVRLISASMPAASSVSGGEKQHVVVVGAGDVCDREGLLLDAPGWCVSLPVRLPVRCIVMHRMITTKPRLLPRQQRCCHRHRP